MGQRVSMALESAFFSDKPDGCSKQSKHNMDHNLRFLLGRVFSRQFWNMTKCSYVKTYQYFRGHYCIHLLCWRWTYNVAPEP